MSSQPRCGRVRPSCLVFVPLVWAVAAGCQSAPTGQAGAPAAESASLPAGLSLDRAADGAVEVRFGRTDAPGPRVVEIHLQPTGTLALAGAEAGEAVLKAQKQLTAQTTRDGLIRLVVLSAGNVNRLDSGVLARLTLSGAGTLALADRRPVFAPAEAEAGAPFGPPITIVEATP